jgi:hypothetical protein
LPISALEFKREKAKCLSVNISYKENGIDIVKNNDQPIIIE